MEMKEHRLINIDNILVNPENPRHNPVIDIGEDFVMKQLVKNKREADSMYKLITDIYTDNWYPQSIVTVTYDEKKDKFIAWDGNRRLTAMKILKYPKLVDEFKNFSYSQIRSIYSMSKELKDESFFEIPCYIAISFKECSGYIRSIHTTDTGALKWDMASIKRFENKLGMKNIFSQLHSFCKNAFNGISMDFPVGKFERIVSSKVGKEYLEIEFKNNTLIPLTQFGDLDNKVFRIVKDIESGKITKEIIKNNTNIKKYLYQGTDINDQNESNEENYDNNNQKVIENNEGQTSLLPQGKQEDQINNRKINANIKKKTKLIRNNNDILFKEINCSKLNYSNDRALGIKNLCYEIQHLSFNNLFKRYPISYCFLIRSILEQASIYFLINKGKWDKWKSDCNGKDLRLETIINKINIDKKNLISDDTIRRAWETCFNDSGQKNYLDLVIHHPYKIKANISVIEAITDMGLFSIIQYFINEN